MKLYVDELKKIQESSTYCLNCLITSYYREAKLNVWRKILNTTGGALHFGTVVIDSSTFFLYYFFFSQFCKYQG